MAKPMIVIAPGSFSPGKEFNALVEHLGSSGYEAIAYDLLTASRKPGERAATLAEDAAFFAGVCAALCDQSQNIVILGHSYGGMVITDAVKGLTQKRVGKGRVLGMIYLTACALKEGQSLGEATAELGTIDFVKVDGDFMYMDPIESSAKTNFSDLPLDQAVACAKRFVFHSALSFGNPLEHAGYADADNVAYIFCTEDKTLTPAFQEQQIANINESREGKRSPVKVLKLASSHCPHASMPVDLARAVVDAVQEFK